MKKFTLIELIAVITILGILATMIIPNISSFQGEATETAIKADAKNLQTSIDMYQLDHYGNYPSEVQPEVGNPQPIKFDLLHPKYLREIPKHEGIYYWVDYQGKVWLSPFDSPINVVNDGTKLSWTEVNGADYYNVFEVVDSATGAVKQTKKIKFLEKVTVNEYSKDVTSSKIYIVSAVSKEGFESAPVGLLYTGYPAKLETDIKPVPEEPKSSIDNQVDLTKYSSVIYVDSIEGNDTTGDGSKDKPYSTITKAIDNIQVNNTAIKIAGGVYYETLKNIPTSFSGTAYALVRSTPDKSYSLIGDSNSLTKVIITSPTSSSYYGNIVQLGNSNATTAHTYEIYNIIFQVKDTSYPISIFSDLNAKYNDTIYFYNVVFDNYNNKIEYAFYINGGFSKVPTTTGISLNISNSIIQANKVLYANGKTNLSATNSILQIPNIGVNYYGSTLKDFLQLTTSDVYPLTDIFTGTFISEDPMLDLTYYSSNSNLKDVGTGFDTDGSIADIGIYGGKYTWVKKNQQSAPSTPIATNITYDSITFSSDVGSFIVMNGISKPSGSTFNNLAQGTIYQAYAYFPESENYYRSDNSNIVSVTTKSLELIKIDLSGGTRSSDRKVYTAPNSVVVTSSAPEYPNSNYYYMDNLFDGLLSTSNTDFYNFWLTSSSGPQTLTFDFLSQQKMKRIIVAPRTKTDSFTNYRILGSNDNVNWTPITDWYYTTSTTPYNTKVNHDLNVDYRYYKFELEQTGKWGVTLAEIEFYH